MKQRSEDLNIRVTDVIDEAIVALMELGCPHKTALSLMATQAIFKMKDLDQLRQIRQEVNSSIICVDDSIDDDTAVAIGPCDCIVVGNPLMYHGDAND